MFLSLVVMVNAQANTYTNAPVNFNPETIKGSDIGGGTISFTIPTPTPSAPSVPEPGQIVLIIAGMTAILIARRRH